MHNQIWASGFPVNLKTMHTEEKRHRAPMKEALIRTCRPKNIEQELAGVGDWHLISN